MSREARLTFRHEMWLVSYLHPSYRALSRTSKNSHMIRWEGRSVLLQNEKEISEVDIFKIWWQCLQTIKIFHVMLDKRNSFKTWNDHSLSGICLIFPCWRNRYKRMRMSKVHIISIWNFSAGLAEFIFIDEIVYFQVK